MKNHSACLFLGVAFALFAGCQPTTSNPSQPKYVNPAESDKADDDGDEGTYGSHDTSSHKEASDVSPIYPTDPLAQLQVEENNLQEIADATFALGDLLEDTISSISLEAVSPIDFSQEIAEESVTE